MSPFASYLRTLRKARRLKQKEAAELLGYEQSYLSSLEGGSKGLPRQPFIDRLISKFHLSQDEINELNRVRKVSARRIVLPANASASEYELWHKLRTQSGQLSPGLLKILTAVLDEAMLPSGASARDNWTTERERGRTM